ncbi:sensor histidine kinase [Streptomyces sp. NPDC055037]
MTEEWRTRLRGGTCGLLVAATLVVAVATTASAKPLISAAGAASVIAALVLTVWSPGRNGVLTVVSVGTAALSLLVTLVYQGPARTVAANWWTAETLALMTILAAAVRRSRPRAALALAAVLSVAIAASPLRITLNIVPPASSDETIQLCLLWAILAMVSSGVGVYLRNLDARGRAAVAAERRTQRLSLARNLHDYAAHDVTAVVVLAEAAQVMAKEDLEKALELLPEITAAGAQALKAMDHTVQLLAEPQPRQEPGESVGYGMGATPLPGPRPRRDLSELELLTERFNRTGSPLVVLDLAEGALDGVDPDVSSVGYRVIVEALTNVRRHAGSASHVLIAVRRVERPSGPGLRIRVTDDAPHPEPGPGLRDRAPRSGGLGIAGLTDQVRALGGELTAAPHRPAGWRVSALLPLRTGPEQP